MSLVVAESANAELDALLEEVCNALQLTQTQYQQAVTHYRAVGEWLKEDPILSGLASRIFPQGSMQLQTTVRPWRYIEYDLDLVYLIEVVNGTTPRALYGKVQRRLMEHQVYRERLNSLPRCLRLTYAGDFHLDVVPACPDPMMGGTYMTRGASAPIPKGTPNGSKSSARNKENRMLPFARWFRYRSRIPIGDPCCVDRHNCLSATAMSITEMITTHRLRLCLLLLPGGSTVEPITLPTH